MFTSSVVMCKILTVVVTFYVWQINSNFFGHDLPPLILISKSTSKVVLVHLSLQFHKLDHILIPQDDVNYFA